MLDLINIKKEFNKGTINETKVFDGFSLHINKGEFVSVVGSNGSGKTTLLNLISGSMPIDDGKIILLDNDITNQKEFVRSKRIGRVHQNPALGTANSMTIAENLSIADNKGKAFNLTWGLNKKRLKYYSDLVATLGLGLENKMDVQVGALSGGQRQALTLLISTMTPIDILLLDEHTAALDPRTSEKIMDITRKIIHEKKLTAIMVTHNLRFAVDYGNRLIMLDRGKSVIDITNEKKENTSVEDLLEVFNRISIECGN